MNPISSLLSMKFQKQRKMQVTLDTSTLQKMYDGVTTVYHTKLKHRDQYSRKEIMDLASLKTHLSSMLDINIIFFRQKELLVDSPYIKRYSKDAKDDLHIEFSLAGLMMIRECLDFRQKTLWEYAKEVRNDPKLLAEVNESITETELALEKTDEFLVPMYN